LSTLFVAPAYQRQGIGRALIEAVVCECKPRSAKPVLKVNSSTVAVTFYLSLGFRQVGPGLARPGGSACDTMSGWSAGWRKVLSAPVLAEPMVSPGVGAFSHTHCQTIESTSG